MSPDENALSDISERRDLVSKFLANWDRELHTWNIIQ